MCGIAGFCNLSSSNFFVDSQLLYKMQQTIVHRGPDGYRMWTSDKQQIGIVHRRLSIVDLSDSGFQPMIDDDVVVCCNGEIYNHQNLKHELESYGHIYKSGSDTETIMHAYKQWGIKCLERLEGMFFILIFDRKKNELYLVRDRIGIKPVYFSLQGNIASFASEIKALWPLPWITKQIKSLAVYHYLTYLVAPAPMTLYEGIYKLPPGFYLKIDAHKNVQFKQWYNLLDQKICYTQKEMKDESFCIERIRHLLRASIKKRMMSDVPFGVFLSGGIDSSLNVALMSEFTDKVKTFNVSFSDGPEYSETTWARKVAKQFNTDHHELVISEKEAFQFFQNMVHHQDEPIGDCVCVPLYYVSKLLKDSGVTVVQVGEGADELFCGYSLYARYLDSSRSLLFSQKHLPGFIKKIGAVSFAKLFPKRFDKQELLNNWANDKALFWGGAIVFPEVLKRELQLVHAAEQSDPVIEQIYAGFGQSYDSYNIVNYHLKNLKKKKHDADFLQTMIYLELMQRLPELLLMRVDKMTMATSVEGRVPFLDHHIVEFALQIPSHLKYKNGVTKYILKKACEGILPHDVIYRKKMGFAAPTTRWFKTGSYFKDYLSQLLVSKRSEWEPFLNIDALQDMVKKNSIGSYDYAYHLWAVQNLMGFDAR